MPSRKKRREEKKKLLKELDMFAEVKLITGVKFSTLVIFGLKMVLSLIIVSGIVNLINYFILSPDNKIAPGAGLILLIFFYSIGFLILLISIYTGQTKNPLLIPLSLIFDKINPKLEKKGIKIMEIFTLKNAALAFFSGPLLATILMFAIFLPGLILGSGNEFITDWRSTYEIYAATISLILIFTFPLFGITIIIIKIIQKSFKLLWRIMENLGYKKD